MFSPKSIKFLFYFLLISAISASCSYWQKTEPSVPDANTFEAVEIKSEVPFSTKEPESFQAEIVVTTGGTESRYFIARNGKNRRTDFNSGGKNEHLFVQNENGGKFRALPNKKIYAETDDPTSVVGQISDNLINSLTTQWLNRKADAKFSSLGTENNLKKYLVILGDGGNSESIIYVDDKIGLPVKQEFYSVNGGKKTLQYKVELKNIKLQASAELFEIPNDYRKVSREQFRKILRKGGK